MILRHEGVQQAFLSIVFVSNQKIKSLNKKYLSRDYATDVLAFDSNDQVRTKTSARRKPRSVSGDVIISTDAAKKNARLYGVSPSQELALYIIHGILHLLGYDDHKAADIQRMRRKEQKILSYLGTKARNILQ